MQAKDFKIGDKIIIMKDLKHGECATVFDVDEKNEFISYFSEIHNMNMDTCFCNKCIGTRIFKID